MHVRKNISAGGDENVWNAFLVMNAIVMAVIMDNLGTKNFIAANRLIGEVVQSRRRPLLVESAY